MANMAENIWEESVQNALADAQAIREGAEQAAKNKILPQLTNAVSKTLVEGFGDDKKKDDDEEDAPAEDAESTESDTDGAEEAPETDDAPEDSEGEEAPETEGEPEDMDAEPDADGDDAMSDDDMGDMGGEEGGQTIEIDPKALATAIADAVLQAIQGGASGADGEEELTSDDLSDDGGEEGEGEVSLDGTDEGGADMGDNTDDNVPFDSEDNYEGEGEGAEEEHDSDYDEHETHDYPNQDMNDSNEDIVIMGDDEEDENENHGKHSMHEGKKENVYVLQDEDDDEECKPSKAIKEENEYLKEALAKIESELSDMRLFNEKVDLFDKIVAKHFNKLDGVLLESVQMDVRNAKQTILDKFDRATTLEEAKNVYKQVTTLCESFNAKLAVKIKKLNTKTEVLKEQIVPATAAKTPRAKKNFKLASAKKTILEEQRRYAQESRENSNGILADAPQTFVRETPTTEQMNEEFAQWSRYK